MTVKEMIEELQKMPPDVECYYGSFSGFLDDNMENTRGVITDKEQHEVYGIDVEFRTVYHYSMECGWIPYTGAIFETD